MHPSAAGAVLAAEPLPGVHWSDLGDVSLATGIIAVVAVVVGIVVLHMLSRRSIGLQLTLISAVTVVTSLAGVGDITYLMLGDTGYRTIMMELLIIAGVAGFLVALVVGRRLTKASRSLLESVQKTGDSGLYIPPTGALPAELAGLSDGLSAAHEVQVGKTLLSLTSREYDLLVFLMKHPRKAFTREQLLNQVWSWTFGDTSTVTVHVRRLREKLESDPTMPRRIVTVWGVGYRYEPGAA